MTFGCRAVVQGSIHVVYSPNFSPFSSDLFSVWLLLSVVWDFSSFVKRARRTTIHPRGRGNTIIIHSRNPRDHNKQLAGRWYANRRRHRKRGRRHNGGNLECFPSFIAHYNLLLTRWQRIQSSREQQLVHHPKSGLRPRLSFHPFPETKQTTSKVPWPLSSNLRTNVL